MGRHPKPVTIASSQASRRHLRSTPVSRREPDPTVGSGDGKRSFWHAHAGSRDGASHRPIHWQALGGPGGAPSRPLGLPPRPVGNNGDDGCPRPTRLPPAHQCRRSSQSFIRRFASCPRVAEAPFVANRLGRQPCHYCVTIRLPRLPVEFGQAIGQGHTAARMQPCGHRQRRAQPLNSSRRAPAASALQWPPQSPIRAAQAVPVARAGVGAPGCPPCPPPRAPCRPAPGRP